MRRPDGTGEQVTEDIVRQYEQRIDNGYRSLSAFSRPPSEAVYAVLAAFDSHILSEYMIRKRLPHKRLTLGPAQKLKLLGEGYIQAMRWLLCEQTAVQPTPRADDELIRSGAELIQYGTGYHQAAIFYQGYSQKVYDAECDPQVARLRFVPRVEEHKRLGWGLADEAAPDLELPPAERRRRNQTRQRAGEVFVRVPHRLTDGRIEITDFVPLDDPRVRDGVPRNAGRPQLLPPTADLSGFTMGEFDAFCHVLHCWSACVMDLYLAYALGGTPQRSCMPTQVVSRADFLRVMCDLSRLPPHAVALILDRLTADHRTRRLDAYLQPFICGEDSVAWSVRAVLLSAPQRNLLKLMARTSAHKNLADNLIGSRERPLLDDLARWLGAKGWDTTANRPLPGPAAGEVDLLGWNWTYPDEVLVVEAKAVLQADEPNEVRAVTRELERAQGQLGRVTRTLQNMDATARRNLYPGVDWPRVSRWYGLVVTPESEPGFGYDPATFPAASLLTLKRRLAAKAWRSPSRVWQATVSRDWQAEFRAGRVVYDSFRLAGVTFEVPLLEY